MAANSDILIELDRTLAQADKDVTARLNRIEVLERTLSRGNMLPEAEYDVYTDLYKEYRAFQFDKAMAMLNARHTIAENMRRNDMIQDVNIDRALLYATSGMFFEAGQLLDNGIDTLLLSDKQLIEYYNARQRFHSDFYNYTSDDTAKEICRLKVRYYRDRIYDLVEESSPLYMCMQLRDLTDAQRWEEAESINLDLLALYDNTQHEYAMYAYDRARILEALERRDEMIEWFARSAIADIHTATKDNASLCSLAQVLLQQQDIDRAFRYINISLEDALFYNAKLRPWQISGIMPEIERAYQDKLQSQMEAIEHEEQKSKRQTLVISILAVALLAICVYMALLLMRSRNAARKIREMSDEVGLKNCELRKLNERMKEINNDLREANVVKEEYIALFLAMCSDYIEKITTLQRSVRKRISQGKAAEVEREFSSSRLVEQELNNFYEMFDNAFLELYPNFVEEFNALLKPEARIELKKGDKLNTELRIYALIRLGISDSSRIASLLRYSVNTIYNYRARTKSGAMGNRDTFDDRVKTIGR